jgi:hypothetical protein
VGGSKTTIDVGFGIGRDAVYVDLRHTKRPCNIVYSIDSDAHVTQQPATPRSPAIDSVDSSRVTKSQALPPHHDLLCRQTYLSDASSDGWQSVTGAGEVDEQRRIPSLRAAALRSSRPMCFSAVCVRPGLAAVLPLDDGNVSYIHC